MGDAEKLLLPPIMHEIVLYGERSLGLSSQGLSRVSGRGSHVEVFHSICQILFIGDAQTFFPFQIRAIAQLQRRGMVCINYQFDLFSILVKMALGSRAGKEHCPRLLREGSDGTQSMASRGLEAPPPERALMGPSCPQDGWPVAWAGARDEAIQVRS